MSVIHLKIKSTKQSVQNVNRLEYFLKALYRIGRKVKRHWLQKTNVPCYFSKNIDQAIIFSFLFQEVKGLSIDLNYSSDLECVFGNNF